MIFENERRCPVCGSSLFTAGLTTYTVDLGDSLVVARNVPARICEQCGEEWISPQTARQLEQLTDEARAKRNQFEVVLF